MSMIVGLGSGEVVLMTVMCRLMFASRRLRVMLTALSTKLSSLKTALAIVIFLELLARR